MWAIKCAVHTKVITFCIVDFGICRREMPELNPTAPLRCFGSAIIIGRGWSLRLNLQAAFDPSCWGGICLKASIPSWLDCFLIWQQEHAPTIKFLFKRDADRAHFAADLRRSRYSPAVQAVQYIQGQNHACLLPFFMWFSIQRLDFQRFGFGF